MSINIEMLKTMKNLQDYIVILQNIISDELCDIVLAEYKNCDDWIIAAIAGGERLDIRNCRTIGLSFNEVIQKNQEPRKKIDTTIYSVATQAIKEYIENMPQFPDNAYIASKDTG